MGKLRIGILHPGQMGISIAASAKNSGHDVYWVSEGRSTATLERAEEHDLIDAGLLKELCRVSDLVISICPPAAAEDVASDVVDEGYKGLFVDANAISPERTKTIDELVTGGGAKFVDGGVIGGPAWKRGTTWLYLAGEEAEAVSKCFAEGPLETVVMDGDIGMASAIKMCFAAYTKGTTALLSAVLASAEALGVREMLEWQWEQYWEGFPKQTQDRVQRVTAKAWRFEGEMAEIAATFDAAGVPGGFHEAAGELYGRIAGFKDADEVPALDEVLQALVRKGG